MLDRRRWCNTNDELCTRKVKSFIPFLSLLHGFTLNLMLCLWHDIYAPLERMLGWCPFAPVFVCMAFGSLTSDKKIKALGMFPTASPCFIVFLESLKETYTDSIISRGPQTTAYPE